MSKHRFVMDVDVNDDALKEHDINMAPVSRDPSEWDEQDLEAALEYVGGSQIVSAIGIIDYWALDDKGKPLRDIDPAAVGKEDA